MTDLNITTTNPTSEADVREIHVESEVVTLQDKIYEE